ncbi:phage major capsid protein [Phenylobacterium sp.]|uniref:phage major capsid protein n=1 Tax=Phenylobacterium sp. TaxID=1871053 RepID=UPI00301D827A
MHSHRIPVSVAALLACSAVAAFPIFNRLEDHLDDPTIVAHRDRQAELNERSSAILAKAEEEKRELTEAELKQIEDNSAEFDTLDRQISARVRVLDQGQLLNAPRGRRTDPDDGVEQVDRPTNRGERLGAEPRPSNSRSNGGFRNFGDFAASVRNAATHRGDVDPRLRNAAASSVSSESVGADGGFAVPPDFREAIAQKVFGEDSLVARTDQMRSASNSITMPVDMTTPWDTTGGIQAYWTNEAAAINQSKIQLEEETFKAHKLAVLVPVTEELLEDAPALNGYLGRKAPEKIDFKVSDAIVRGTGAGQPLGFMNSPALVTVAAEGGQTPDTIVAANISKMWSRMPTSSRRNAVWLVHPDAEPQLDFLSVGQQPVYMPPGGLSEAPYGRLKGRPVIPHQVCETIGDLGDIMLVDLAQYLSLVKTGGGRDSNGLKSDVSMHLWFDQDLVAFKFTLRIGGQPWWSKATSPRDGSSTMSPFVTLASR